MRMSPSAVAELAVGSKNFTERQQAGHRLAAVRMAGCAAQAIRGPGQESAMTASHRSMGRRARPAAADLRAHDLGFG